MTVASIAEVPVVRAKPSGFFRDLITVAGRAIRAIPREPESFIPALIVPVFFFVVNTGSLSSITEGVAKAGGQSFDYAAFQLPVAIIFAVTGISRASALVADISDGYFDRLLLTPVKRLTLLLGLMCADFVLVVALTIPVLIMGWIFGVHFETGLPGIIVFVLLAAAWGLAFTGFPYAIALKTGSAAAVNSSFILFFPFAFLTTAFVPQEALSGLPKIVAPYNPVTYLLKGLRSVVSTGWVAKDLAEAVAAVLIVAFLSIGLALLALRSRVRQN